MNLDKPDKESARAAGSDAGWLDDVFDRRERTVGGVILGAVRDLLDPGTTPELIKNARARSNDEITHIAADTVAFLPSLKWTAGGLVRATMLIDPGAGVAENLTLFGKNFAEGAALNKVGKLAGPESSLSRALGANLGKGLVAESVLHMSVGFGAGAVKSGFNPEAWKDKSGQFSLAGGMKNILTHGGLASLVNIPAGMLGVRVSRAATVAMGEGTISPKVAALIQGAGAGYAGGVVFGGIEGFGQSSNLSEMLAYMHKGGMIGAFAGGFVHGYEHSRLAVLSGSRRPVVPPEEKGLAVASAKKTLSDVHAVDVRRETVSSRQPYSGDLLTIKPEPLGWQERVELSRRLHPPRHEKAIIEVPKEGVSGPFKSYKDFRRRAIQEVTEDVRLYKVGGHSAEIIIPETYARGLDEVRLLRHIVEGYAAGRGDSNQLKTVQAARERLEKHPFKHRALPEDFIPYLDQLPDRSLVKRLILVDGTSPEDVWMQQIYEPDFHAMATASPSGDIVFYSAERNSFLRGYLFHEWAHLVKFKLADESVLFDLAAELEPAGDASQYYVSKYSRLNHDENFAVHMGEELLSLNGDEFVRLADQAPIRTAIFGRALARVFGSAPAWARSQHHVELNNRLQHMMKVTLPKAQEALFAKISSGDLAAKKLAVKLLGPLGNKSHLDSLVALARRSPDTQLSEFALDAALKIARDNGAKLKVLFDVGTPGSLMRERAIALAQCLPDERAPSYWRLISWRGDRSNLPDLVRLITKMPDAAGKRLAFQEAWQLARKDGDQAALVELVRYAPDQESKRLAFEDAWKLAGSRNDHKALARLMREAPDSSTKEFAFEKIAGLFDGNAHNKAMFAAQILEIEPALRKPALRLLGAIGDPAADPQVRKLLNDPDPEIADLARAALYASGKNEELAQLKARTKVGTPESKAKAIRTLGALQDHRAIEPLLEVLSTGDPLLAPEALAALRNYVGTVVKFEARRLSVTRPELSSSLRAILSGQRGFRLGL